MFTISCGGVSYEKLPGNKTSLSVVDCNVAIVTGFIVLAIGYNT